MGYFQVRYDSRVVNYDHRGFIRLATGPGVTLIEVHLLQLHRQVDQWANQPPFHRYNRLVASR